MRRPLIVVFAVAALVLVAGCTGNGGTADGSGTITPMDETPTAPDGTTPTPGGGEGGGDSAAPDQYTHFDFAEGERYRYDVMLGGEQGTLLWEVRDVTGDRVTVHLRFEFATTFERTVTGSRANIRQKLADTRFGELVTSGLLTPFDAVLQDRALEVGKSWSATTAEGSAEVAVIGTNTYAGVECYTTEVRVDGNVRYTACLSPRLGLVVHSAVTPEGKAGAQSVAFELVEYSTDAGDTATPTAATSPTAAPTATPTAAPTPTTTPTGESSGWSVHFAYDGRWTGTITVTTDRGRSTQAFTGDGDRTIDVDSQLGVDPQDVRSITATAEKQAGDDRTLRIAVRKDGDVVAEASTDAPHGETVASHHE